LSLTGIETMSDSEEEQNVSKPGTSKPRVPSNNDKKRRSKSSQEELDKTEKEEVARMYGNTDQNLEKCAQAHNMTALNVKTVLRSMIKNHRALARVLGTDVEDDEAGEGLRNTRSRTKAGQPSHNVDMTSSVRIKNYTFVDVPFNDDDEFDNDWRPDDEEEVTDSSRQGSSDEDESEEHLSGIDDEERDEDEDELQDLTIVESPKGDDTSIGDRRPNEIRPQSRARHSMNLTLNAINFANDEPSHVYNEFINGINNEESAYNEEEDPDFRVPADELFNEEPDQEEASYWNNIPQREVEALFQDIVTPDKLEDIARNMTPPRPVRRHEIKVLKVAIPTKRPQVVVKEEISDISITTHHIEQIRVQLEQHIQLLTQAYVGCYFEPLLQNEREKAFDMIESLVNLSSSSLYLPSSTFHSPNLVSAIHTCNGMKERTLDVPLVPIPKEELTIPRGLLPCTKEVLSNSTAILYPHLVSHQRMVQSIGTSGWTSDECILLAMALNRFADLPETPAAPRNSKYNKIAMESMPWRTPNDLRWQSNGMKRGLKRNGQTRHNEHFFNVVSGSRNFQPPHVPRVQTGWTMADWPPAVVPPWYIQYKMRQKKNVKIQRKVEKEEKKESMGLKRRKRERKIDDGDEEMEAIVIVENEDEEDGEIDVEGIDQERNVTASASGKKDIGVFRKVEGRGKENERIGEEEGSEEVEKTRGGSDGDKEEMTGDGIGAPIDFSHLMEEMPPTGTRQQTPPRRGRTVRSTTPYEKTMLPPTPGKRIPSPTEDSLAWFEHMQHNPLPSSPPPHCSSPSSHSRIKTPGGTWDYVDSLKGYFGTPEREVEGEIEREDGPSTSKRSNAYSNLFGDFDFDESDTNDDVSSPPEKRRKELLDELEVEKEIAMEENIENGVDETVGDEKVKRRKKRPTREEKEKIGLEAINDPSFRRRIMNSLARKTAHDIISRMNMHSSIFKQIQHIIMGRVDNEDKEKMFVELIDVLSPEHKEVLYLLSVFASPSSLPRTLVLSPSRHAYVAAIDIMCTICAYMFTIQRRMSYRQLLRTIVDAYSKGGSEGVTKTLKEILVNDPVLLKVLLEYNSPSIPPPKDPQWEVVDLRKGEEAFKVFKENPSLERVDQCEIMGGVLTKRQLITMGKTPSALLPNNDGEPCLRRKDGKYSEIIVESEEQMEEERKSRQMEKEEEKKAKKREKTKERMKIVKKAKMAERREEKAKEKKNNENKRKEDEEKKKTVDEPTLPFTRDVDRALLLMYNEVQRVTKRAARKLGVDLPYSTNFTLEQLQNRLDFLLALANQE
ncbi:hypothetical protein PFISCL1PPCAC_14902, partial [Pristionchus fissidentatus]